MLVSTDNRMASAMNFPNLATNPIALVTDVSAPGSDYQNASYGMAGMGTVLDDITSGNFSNLPSSVVSGLGNGDIGSYLVVAGIAALVLPLLLRGGNKARARQLGRRASLKGSIARETELLKGA